MLEDAEHELGRGGDAEGQRVTGEHHALSLGEGSVDHEPENQRRHQQRRGVADHIRGAAGQARQHQPALGPPRADRLDDAEDGQQHQRHMGHVGAGRGGVLEEDRTEAGRHSGQERERPLVGAEDRHDGGVDRPDRQQRGEAGEELAGQEDVARQPEDARERQWIADRVEAVDLDLAIGQPAGQLDVIEKIGQPHREVVETDGEGDQAQPVGEQQERQQPDGGPPEPGNDGRPAARRHAAHAVIRFASPRPPDHLPHPASLCPHAPDGNTPARQSIVTRPARPCNRRRRGGLGRLSRIRVYAAGPAFVPVPVQGRTVSVGRGVALARPLPRVGEGAADASRASWSSSTASPGRGWHSLSLSLGGRGLG